MTEIFTAKTVDEAKALAAKKFGKNLNEIKFEVIEEGKKGFFGIGQSDAKVKATYIAPVPKRDAPKAAAVKEAPKPAAPEKKEPVKEAPKTEPTAEVKKSEPVKVTPKPVSEPKSEVKKSAAEETVTEAPKTEEVKENAAKDDDMELSLEDFVLIEDEALMNPKVKLAKDYITGIFKAMNINAEFVVYQNETGAVINIESNNNGTIIGRRGETLDSIQYLCSIIANKGDKDYFRITIDCLGYRTKRKETLEQLAAKVAKSVIKTGRSQQLEPMNPYERRVIHSAVSEIEGVSSRSVGEEPYRKIIISSTNPKNSKGDRGGRGGRGSRRDDRRGGRQGGRGRRRENFEPKAIDLSTSFEKDYKKPKPEDSMEGEVYGKIEF